MVSIKMNNSHSYRQCETDSRREFTVSMLDLITALDFKIDLKLLLAQKYEGLKINSIMYREVVCS